MEETAYIFNPATKKWKKNPNYQPKSKRTRVDQSKPKTCTAIEFSDGIFKIGGRLYREIPESELPQKNKPDHDGIVRCRDRLITNSDNIRDLFYRIPVGGFVLVSIEYLGSKEGTRAGFNYCKNMHSLDMKINKHDEETFRVSRVS